MENYIYITGIELWVFLFFVVFLGVSAIVLGASYVNELREKERYQEKYRNLLRANSILQLSAELKGSADNADRSKE